MKIGDKVKILGGYQKGKTGIITRKVGTNVLFGDLFRIKISDSRFEAVEWAYQLQLFNKEKRHYPLTTFFTK
jgi:hypothetical protein